MKHQKKLAVINDLSGYGRCSLTVALPVVSAMGIQCCPVPTSILSNHTGYPAYFFDDYTKKLPSYIGKWKALGFSFDGILTGFLGSAEQISIVEDFIRHFTAAITSPVSDPMDPDNASPDSMENPHLHTDSKHRALVIIDPIMGDGGKIYSTLTPQLCDRMKHLCSYADILTPNLTEACILTDTPYKPHFTKKELATLLGRLATLCPGRIVLTGIDAKTYLANVIFDPSSGEAITLRNKRVAAERCGTGDLFSAILTGGVLNGMPLKTAVQKAAAFLCLCLKETAGYDISASDGVVFEPLLKYLM